MGTVLLLVITTLLGGLIGHVGFEATAIGALIGFVVGVIIRIVGAGGLDDTGGIFD